MFGRTARDVSEAKHVFTSAGTVHPDGLAETENKKHKTRIGGRRFTVGEGECILV